jgi:hypothetical protein
MGTTAVTFVGSHDRPDVLTYRTPNDHTAVAVCIGDARLLIEDADEAERLADAFHRAAELLPTRRPRLDLVGGVK